MKIITKIKKNINNLKISKIEQIDCVDKVYSLSVTDNKNFFLDNKILSSNSLMILDEAQNCTWKQIMLFVTRMGKDSKVIISGDISQYDIQKDMMALLGFSNMVKGIKNVGVFEFTKEDIMRHPILIEITDKYEKLKYAGKIKEEQK